MMAMTQTNHATAQTQNPTQEFDHKLLIHLPYHGVRFFFFAYGLGAALLFAAGQYHPAVALILPGILACAVAFGATVKQVIEEADCQAQEALYHRIARQKGAAWARSTLILSAIVCAATLAVSYMMYAGGNFALWRFLQANPVITPLSVLNVCGTLIAMKRTVELLEQNPKIKQHW